MNEYDMKFQFWFVSALLSYIAELSTVMWICIALAALNATFSSITQEK